MEEKFTLTARDLIHFRTQGFLVGPREEAQSFLKRYQMLRARSLPPLLEKETFYDEKTAFKDLFGCDLVLPVFYSSSHLHLWQGAVTHLYPLTSQISIPFIQLHPRFFKKEKGFYDTQEILNHEGVHMMRMAFEEVQFEELFAYFTSKKKFRRLLGPLFRTPQESLLFLISILGSMILQWQFPSLFFLVAFPPLFWGARLFKDRFLLKKAFHVLEKLFQTKNPLEIAIHLTDQEIRLFSKGDLEALKQYIATEKSLRWQQILACFHLA